MTVHSCSSDTAMLARTATFEVQQQFRQLQHEGSAPVMLTALSRLTMILPAVTLTTG